MNLGARMEAPTPAHALTCPSCSSDMELFFELEGVPVNSCLLVGSREEALAFPRGDIRLGVCPACGMVSNLAFDRVSTEYSGRYEETQAFSGTFNRFHQALAADLVERLGVRGKTVVEVGCGKGEFLALLCGAGRNRGIGYDPSFDAARGVFAAHQDVQVIREFFGPRSGQGNGDLVCCKMTLEHVLDTAVFARSLRAAMRPGSDSVLFIQVPESTRILRDCAFEDVYYEHCSYFTPGSLARLFRRAGFQVERLTSTYGNQYLTLEARLADSQDQDPLPEEEPATETLSLARTFADRFAAQTADWSRIISESAASGPVVLWGSGSKAVAFLRATDPASRGIKHVVDINPYRQGSFMAGTGQQILSPERLRNVAPALVIVMNPIYRQEVEAELARTGVDTPLLTL